MLRQDANVTLLVVVLAPACGPVVSSADTDDGRTTGSSTPTTASTTTMGPTSTAGELESSPSEDSLDDSSLKWDHTVGPDQPSGDDGSPMTLPECPEFDPGRVYLHGTLLEGAAYAEAVTDPLDPNNFCVGFTLSTDVGIRGTDGRVILVDGYEGNAIREFEPDPIGINRFGSWDYPLDPYANDPIVIRAPCDRSSTPFEVVMSPLGDVFYSCPPQWFAPGGVLLPAGPNSPPIAITATGDAILFDEVTRSLHVVTPGGDLGDPLELPRDVGLVHTGRVHDDGVWLVALDWDNVTAYRWTLIDATVVLEDGVYSTSPDADAMPQLRSGAIDAEGDFWHTAYDANTVDVILRRRLAPDESEVVYREDQDPEPAVKIHGSRLFTGP